MIGSLAKDLETAGDPGWKTITDETERADVLQTVEALAMEMAPERLKDSNDLLADVTTILNEGPADESDNDFSVYTGRIANAFGITDLEEREAFITRNAAMLKKRYTK